MLVLTRKESQRIEMGDGIAIVVRRIHSRRVVLGVEAPAGVSILRDELADSKGRFEAIDGAVIGAVDEKPRGGSGRSKC